jgi:hypothetical protein
MQVARSELGAVGNTSFDSRSHSWATGVGTGWLLPRPIFAQYKVVFDERLARAHGN